MSHSCASLLCVTPHYEDSDTSEIEEIICPVGIFTDCRYAYDREDLKAHLSAVHPEENQDVEAYFEAVANGY